MKKTLFLVFILFVFVGFNNNAMAISVTSTSDGALLVNTILGSGVTVSNINYSGASGASGTFTDGLSSGIGIESGIVLTSGNASLIDNINNSDRAIGNNGLPGDSDLGALVPQTTYDATVLEFDFVSSGGDLFFNYLFGSEEYNEYTNTAFNDVFAFFMDGSNIALIPGTTVPVSVNNVNGGNPLGTNASNPDLFNNNDLSDGGPFFDFEYDGFTDVFTAQALGLSAGTHHIKLAIADSGDYILDSGVFIQAGTFSDLPTPPTPPPPPPPPSIPDPSAALLLGSGLIGFAGFRRKFKK